MKGEEDRTARTRPGCDASRDDWGRSQAPEHQAVAVKIPIDLAVVLAARTVGREYGRTRYSDHARASFAVVKLVRHAAVV